MGCRGNRRKGCETEILGFARREFPVVWDAMRFWGAFSAVFMLVLGLSSAASARPPVIRHEPARVAVRGQSLSVRAAVTSATASIKNVYLYYAMSRDAAPFKLTMQSAGAGVYLGTVPGALLGSASQLSYYIEAVDDHDGTSETDWCTVELRAPNAVGAESGKTESSQRSWVKPALYAGGVAALIGGAAWAASSGGGGSGGSANTNAVGSYVGTVTTCLEFTGSPPTCSSNPMRILITSEGTVTSDTLRNGVYVEGRLSGNDFTINSAVNETNTTGEIRYSGTLIDNTRITGSISGPARTDSGTNGVYSGTFNATKQ
jgi:hypothetical protein